MRDPVSGRQLRQGGFATRADAEQGLDTRRRHLLDGPDDNDAPSNLTTGEWLEHWLAQKSSEGASTAGRKIAPTTTRSYRAHLDLYLLPYLEDIPLAQLSPQHVSDLFRRLGTPTPERAAAGATAIRRVYATLRSALNVAVRKQLVATNPCNHVELPAATRPRAMVWTPEREAVWRRTGVRPSPVMVWTPEQTGHFLASITDDPLYPYYHLIALRGLRRGEAVGLRWPNVDLDCATIVVCEQIVQLGWRTLQTSPKAGSDRIVALDRWTAEVLRQHRKVQAEQLRALYLTPEDVGWVFTRADGQPYHPNYVTVHFSKLIKSAELPPIRLHDLRHGAATLALAGGADLKVVQDMLGHSSITLTADTYTSVLPQVARAAAEAAAAVVPRRRRELTVIPLPPGSSPDQPE